ncbi:MAG: pyridoxamine 5'-phosphate oxidase family protein [Rhodospirillaceae bacterium]|nr:pyridoxamine 5'-phosphate oxidase family protein [Rhodospirillaceae bacterium]
MHDLTDLVCEQQSHNGSLTGTDRPLTHLVRDDGMLALNENDACKLPLGRSHVPIEETVMLTAEMTTLITNHTAGMVATIRDDGLPAVSPKATFVVLDKNRIAFGNIRSSGTVANIRKRPAVEVCFIDVLARKAVRVVGEAVHISKARAEPDLVRAFEPTFGDYIRRMAGFVVITLSGAELILSPAYDSGITEAELRRINLDKLNNMHGPDRERRN